MSFLDKISSKFSLGKSSQNSEYYFALIIGLSEITAVVWGIIGNKLDILGQSSHQYSGNEDLMDKANIALDEALGPAELEPKKILFGVPDSWSSEDNLKEPYARLLKKMVSEFDLEPMAYVTTTHAVAHLLQKQEGVPPTAILIGLGEHIEATLVRGGKVVESRNSKRGDHIFDDIEKVLLQLTEVEVLPSKILLYSTIQNQNLEKIREELMTYPWMQKLPFLHFPRIELMNEETSYHSVVFAGAVELNPHIDVKHSFKKSPIEAPLVHKSLGGEHSHKSGAGFVAGDIQDHSQEIDEDQDLDDDNLMMPDIEGEEDEIPAHYRKIGQKRGHQIEEEVIDEPVVATHQSSRLPAIYNYLPAGIGTGFLSPIKGVFGGGRGPLGLLLNPFVMLILVFMVGGLAFLFLTKAEVAIYVEPNVLEKSAQVTADPKATQVDQSQNIIPATIVKTQAKGDAKGMATGNKEIGDPAKGQVVLYNKTDASKSFSSGTILEGPTGLKFTLDGPVNVASRSAVEGGIVFGKATTSVTASAIGPDSNLPAGIEMKVSGQSDSSFNAKVDQALSGGTSKTVTVVTSDDQKKLKAQLLEDLKEKAKSQLQQEVTDGKKIVTDALTVVDSNFSFSKAVNDQTKEFSVNATVSFKGTAYSEPDLKSFVAKLVETNIPEGFEFDINDTETSADVSKIEPDGRLVFLAKYKAKLLPKVNTNDVKSKIKGKSIEEVSEQLKKMDHVIGSEIKLKPNWPKPLNRLPFLDQNIKVAVTTK